MTVNINLNLIIWIVASITSSHAATDPALVLTCSFNSKIDGELEYISGEQYACDLQSDLPYIDAVTLTVNDTHEEPKTDLLVTALLVNEREIFQVPKVIDIFPGLKYIKITKASALKYLRKESIAEYKENLEHLIIQESGIEVIEADLFSGFTAIITIDLQHNKIFYIADNVFDGFTALKNILLTGNDCKNTATPPVDIGNCQATDLLPCATFILGIGTSTCKPEPIAIDKFLTYQKTISELELDAYTALEAQHTLNENFDLLKEERNNLTRDYDAAKTQINDLKTEIEILIPKVSKLELEAEKCMDVEGTCRFTVDSSYGYSCIAHNVNVSSAGQEVSWTGTHQSSSTSKSVLSLLIRDLIVNYVPKDIGLAFSNLKNLVIQNCGLSKLSSNDFVSLGKLESIQIMSNEIALIESGAFDVLESLKTLDLSGNKIKVLPSKVFAKLQELSSINLNKNELTAVKSDFLPPTNSIQSFTAKDNKLVLVESSFVWRLRSAKAIDLSGNSCNLKYDRDAGGNYIDFYNSILKRC